MKKNSSRENLARERSDGEAAEASGDQGSAIELSRPQQVAIEVLTAGRSVVDSAKAAGVSRFTVHRWLKEDVGFAAAYNSWQEEMLETARARVLGLADGAVNAVGKALENGDAKTALVVLKSLGVLKEPKPGATDPDRLAEDRELEQMKRKERILLAGTGFEGL